MILSLLLIGLRVLSTSSADEQVSLTTTPQHYDDWCSSHCDSLIACTTLYGSNHVDLRLRVKFPIDDGPGRHLIQDKYFGVPSLDRVLKHSLYWILQLQSKVVHVVCILSKSTLKEMTTIGTVIAYSSIFASTQPTQPLLLTLPNKYNNPIQHYMMDT